MSSSSATGSISRSGISAQADPPATPSKSGIAAVVSPTLPPPPQRWLLEEHSPDAASALAAAAHLSHVVAELLLARGIADREAAHRFLHPEIGHLIDPFAMRDMQTAVERIERALAHEETILLYGDYDVDGATAVVLLKTALEMIAGPAEAGGAKIRFHVPHRLREGYGIQSSVLEAAAAEGVHLVISVDTGMRAFAEAARARELGLDLIITDHHLPDAGDDLPDALAILNPNQPGCEYPEKFLCGAAIAFKLAVALLLRHDPERTQAKIIPSFLKMVAIATVADAVPLRGENRVLATLGIRELHRPAGIGLRALMQAANLDPAARPLSSFDLGFRLAPRINAAGRMDIASEVVELFTTRDNARAAELAQKLERLNLERREAEAAMLRQIEHRLATDAALANEKMIVMSGEAWHRGIIGILASRIVDRTAKPAIVVSIEEGIAYGSGRSVDGFPLLDALESCAELYTRFGGHAFAVGFALPAERLPEMERRLYAFARTKLAERDAEHILRIHAELPIERVTPALAAAIKRIEPYGHGNPEPLFLARALRLAGPVRIMKERHIRLELLPTHTASAALSAAPIRVVGWNMAQLAQNLNLQPGNLIDLAYRIRENDHPEYGGLEIEIAGIRLAQ